MSDSNPLASLGIMLGKGVQFEVGERRYVVLPLTLSEVWDFLTDPLPIRSPVALLGPTYKRKTGEWLKRKVRTESGRAVTLSMIVKHGWTVANLRACFETLVDISGLTFKRESAEEESIPDDVWGEVFTTIVSHTSIGYWEIPNLTLPQISELMNHLGKHISLKLGVPLIDEKEGAKAPDKEHTVEDGMAFAALFNGIS